MEISLIEEDQDYIPLLKAKMVHMVGFSEVGLSYFRAYLEFAFDFSLDDAVKLCERINKADETGTIFPRGYLSGIPVRFFRQPICKRSLKIFQSCLRDAFIANRDYCKSQVMVFHYACAIDNRDLIVDQTISMAQTISDDPNLESVVIIVDDAIANTPLQRAILKKESSTNATTAQK